MMRPVRLLVAKLRTPKRHHFTPFRDTRKKLIQLSGQNAY